MNKLITAPTLRPISLAAAKLHAKIDHATDDALIDALIVAATERAEHYTGRKLISQTWEYVVSDFEDIMRLPFAPVQSITSIKYMDTDNVEQTLASSVYDLIDEALPPRVVLKYGQTWPSVYDAQDAVRIRYVAGYGDNPGQVPEGIRSWMLVRIANMYALRDTLLAQGVTMLPAAFIDSLLDDHSIPQVV